MLYKAWELNILVCGSEQGGNCIPLLKNHCLAVSINKWSQVYWYTRTQTARALITYTVVLLKQKNPNYVMNFI